MSSRVSFLIDGFNLYHSLEDWEVESGICVKWLDLKSVCNSFLMTIANSRDENLVIEGIYYFTARISHYQKGNPQRVAKQRIYMKAVEATGVEIVEGAFREKYPRCRNCGRKYRTHEEKMTDVAIACKALELCHKDLTDIVVVITGDTDQIPPLNYINENFPQIRKVVVFPRGRVNNELRSYADIDLTLSSGNYSSNQFPDEITLSNGKTLTKPPTW